MKDIGELKRHVNIRMRKCWGESVAMFVMSSGMISLGLFVASLTSQLLKMTDGSKRIISDEWIMAIACAVIFLLWLIAVIPYKYGSRWYRLQQVRGHAVHAKSIFSCYFSAKKTFKVYKTSIAVMARLLIWFLILSVLMSGSVYMIIKINEKGQGVLYSFAVVLMLMLTAAMLVGYAALNLKYLAVPYLFALGQDRSVKDIIEDSRRYMKGNEKYMGELARTMILYLLPCVLVFPMFFLVPYVKMLYTAAINEIVENGFEQDKTMDAKRGIKLEI